MLILDMPMPRACDACPMLDDSGDYPMCRVTQEMRGYNFNTREKRMDRCPIKGEFIQCRDCKHFKESDDGNGVCWRDNERDYYGIYGVVTSDYYCADGERREEDAENRE